MFLLLSHAVCFLHPNLQDIKVSATSALGIPSIALDYMCLEHIRGKKET